ncbi:hypothetical protein HQN87_31375 [Paenibacillus tritici]|uniref:DUF6843 domain-containing protein n=1 Tax=Paenibacillus tritici TaxID=1873425 RepID=A0ABX2DZU5_9BACL|nr:hypothetical protein [Paenibacillus tritici]NQX49804.1 hypothetical protein [Paenibacillus tritici]
MRKVLSVFIPWLLILVACSSNKSNLNTYLIPENYVGWVQIIYNQEGFDPIKQVNGKKNTQQKIDVDQMIHGHHIGDGESVNSSGKIEGPTVQEFFVGTETELQNTPDPEYPVELMK